MERFVATRRELLRAVGLATGALLFSPKHIFAAETEPAADYTVRIKVAPIEIAPNQILSTVTYNGQFPGPLIRFQQGREEGTPYIPAHGRRRISFTPNPPGLRFYHTHNRAEADLSAGWRDQPNHASGSLSDTNR